MEINDELPGEMDIRVDYRTFVFPLIEIVVGNSRLDVYNRRKLRGGNGRRSHVSVFLEGNGDLELGDIYTAIRDSMRDSEERFRNNVLHTFERPSPTNVIQMAALVKTVNHFNRKEIC